MFFIIYLHMYDTVWLYMHMCDCIDTYIYIYSDLKTLGHKFIIAAFLVDQKMVKQFCRVNIPDRLCLVFHPSSPDVDST